MTIHYGYLCIAGFLFYALCVLVWLDWNCRHAPLLDESGHPVDENGKRLK